VGVAKILKEAEADLTIKDKDGYTAINLINGGAMWKVLHQVQKLSRERIFEVLSKHFAN